jgi:eukaryotic-like serine/threonine-protein kinase
MELKIGTVIDNTYRVDKRIASGGMGTVYLVWDLKRSVHLAMKVLNDDPLENPDLLAMFQREADHLKDLAHPNIVPFYGFFQSGELSYLLTHFIDGQNLAEYMRTRPDHSLSLGNALICLKALCAALGYAHGFDVVHCDIKPGNVMIDGVGKIFLTDFGIARHADSTKTLIRSIGTPGYNAPEQIYEKKLTPAADIYALGIVLYEMITGSRPSRPDAVAPHPALNSHLARVIRQALAYKPEDRYKSAQEFLMYACRAAGLEPSGLPDCLDLGNPAAAGNMPFELTKTNDPPSQNRNLFLAAWSSPAKRRWGMAAAAAIVLFTAIVSSKGIWPHGPFSPPTSTPSPKVIALVAKGPDGIASQPMPSATFTPEPTPAPTITFTAAPTVTATPPSPTPLPTYYPIPGCAASRVHLHSWFIIGPGGVGNILRSSADTHPSDNKIGYISPGELLYITDGPVCNYGWLLWYVHTSSGQEGWTPETNGTDYWFEPLPTRKVCPDSPASLLHTGDRAQVTLYPQHKSRLRETPGLSGAITALLNPGDTVEVIDGPQCKDKYVWWRIQTSSSTIGWTAEGDSVDYFLIPVSEQP